jgi:hypothetical protein
LISSKFVIMNNEWFIHRNAIASREDDRIPCRTLKRTTSIVTGLNWEWWSSWWSLSTRFAGNPSTDRPNRYVHSFADSITDDMQRPHPSSWQNFPRMVAKSIDRDRAEFSLLYFSCLCLSQMMTISSSHLGWRSKMTLTIGLIHNSWSNRWYILSLHLYHDCNAHDRLSTFWGKWIECCHFAFICITDISAPQTQ